MLLLFFSYFFNCQNFKFELKNLVLVFMQVLIVELINNIYYGFLLCCVGLDVFFVLDGVYVGCG
jgi:hypothetical protein